MMFLASCSGGSSSAPSPAPQPSATATGNGTGATPALTQKVSFTINVPAPSALASQARRFRAAAIRARAAAAASTSSPNPSSGLYVSPKIGSITVRLVEVNGVSLKDAPPASGPVNAPASCAAGQGCTFAVPNVVAAIGTNYYAVQTYIGPNATGNLISSALIFVPVNGSGAIDKALGDDPTQLSAGGFVYGLQIATAPAAFITNTSSAVSVVVTATDATGATLIGNVQYFSPVLIAVAGSGITLSGPGLNSNGGITLTGPQPVSPPIFAVYDGSRNPAAESVTASTTDGNGNPVQATATIAFATPTPGPTTAPPTPTPTPTASHTPVSVGQTPPPTTAPPVGPPDSVYVVNAGTNIITEFPDPAAGVNPLPRRFLGGLSIPCQPTVNASTIIPGVQSVAVDSAGNVTVASANTSGANCSVPSLYRFTASSLSTAAPAAVEFPAMDTAGGYYVDLLANLTSASSVYESDSGSNNNYDALWLLGLTNAVVGGTANAPVLEGFGQIIAGGLSNCVVSSGRADTNSPPCYFGDLTELDYALTDPAFALLNDGNIVVSGSDAGNGGNPVLMFLPPQTPTAAVPDKAGPLWIESSTYLPIPVTALAYDATTNLIYAALPGGSTSANGPANCSTLGNSAVACPDGNYHYYVEAFDYGQIKTLISAGQTGAVDLPPKFILGGAVASSWGFPASASSANGPNESLQPNFIAAANGRLYITNIFPNGFCDATCTQLYFGSGSTLAYPYSGQVDIYNVSALSGYHVNDTAPIATITNVGLGNNALNVPVAIAIGPSGSVTSLSFRARHASRTLTARQRSDLARLRAARLRQQLLQHR